MNLEEILKQVEFAERLALGDFDLPEMKISLTEIIRSLVERVKEAEEVLSAHAILIKRTKSSEWPELSSKAQDVYLSRMIPMIESGVEAYLEKHK